MKILELVQKVKESQKEKLGQMTDKKIALIIKESLLQIKQEIDNEDDIVRIPGLGNFRTKIVERKIDGKKILKKHIVFNSIKNK